MIADPDFHSAFAVFTRTPLQIAALVYGIVFLLAGAAGFIPGITTNWQTMQFAGPHSEAMLLGLFQVSILHNLVHLLYGVVGVKFARAEFVKVNEARGS